MVLRCYAKINWALKVLKKRQDNYHDLDMLMQSINIFDEIDIQKHMHDELCVNGQKMENIYENLCFKAVETFRKHLKITQCFRVNLKKQIPIGAGMGGGSADAAGVFIAVNELCNTKLPLSELERLGKKIGADIPFMLRGGFAHVKGIGDNIYPVIPSPSYNLLIVFDDLFISTKEVFQIFSDQKIISTVNIDKIFGYLTSKDLCPLKEENLNDLYDSALMLQPEIHSIITEMYSNNAALASMTGSGSAVFALFDTDIELLTAYRTIKKNRKFCVIAKTMPCGVEIIEK